MWAVAFFLIESLGMGTNLSLWAWIGLAIVAAWGVGAYSRLLRLRLSAEQARSSLRKYLLRCRDIPEGEFTAVKVPMMAELLQVASLAEQWGRDPSSDAVPPGLGAAIDHVAQGLTQIRSEPEDLAGALLPEELLKTWESLLADISARRIRYNVHASELNEALLQVPASLLARLTRMHIMEVL